MSHEELIEQFNQKNLSYDGHSLKLKSICDLSVVYDTMNIIHAIGMLTIVGEREHKMNAYDSFEDDWEEREVECEVFINAYICEDTICEYEIEECVYSE